MNDNVRNAAGRLLVLTTQVEDLLVALKKQTQESQAALRATREKEAIEFHQDMTAVLDHQQQRIEAALRPKIVRAWQFVGITAVVVILMVGGAIGLSSHYLGVIKENKLSAEMLKAINRADVTLCDGNLCAQVDKKAKRWGEKGEYLPVRPR